jgi:hypothetical protein
MLRFVIGMLLSAALLVSIPGCGEGGNARRTVRVAGTVYLDDQPLEGAQVRFFADDFVSFATTGPDGRYELVQGAVLGSNKVAISKIEGGDIEMDPESGFDDGQLEAMISATGDEGNALNLPRELIPIKYSDPEKSELTYPVPEGGTTEADFRLSSQ